MWKLNSNPRKINTSHYVILLQPPFPVAVKCFGCTNNLITCSWFMAMPNSIKIWNVGVHKFNWIRVIFCCLVFVKFSQNCNDIEKDTHAKVQRSNITHVSVFNMMHRAKETVLSIHSTHSKKVRLDFFPMMLRFWSFAPLRLVWMHFRNHLGLEQANPKSSNELLLSSSGRERMESKSWACPVPLPQQQDLSI